VVTEPGIYPDLPNVDYFTASDWVSCSQLKRRLPEWYKPFTGSPSADIGSVLHARFTGDDTPLTVVDAATWQGKAAKETRETVTASGGYAVLASDLGAIDGMFEALSAHCVARRLLVEATGAWELSVFSEPDGVPSRCRFDRLLDDGTAIDIKTFAGKPSRYEIARAVMTWGYELQQTHYTEVAKAAGIELESFTFLFVCKESPHYVIPVELDDAWLTRGAVLRDIALSRFLHPEFSDPYEGAEETLTLDLPNYGRI
jgi:hypothetical protein